MAVQSQLVPLNNLNGASSVACYASRLESCTFLVRDTQTITCTFNKFRGHLFHSPFTGTVLEDGTGGALLRSLLA